MNLADVPSQYELQIRFRLARPGKKDSVCGATSFERELTLACRSDFQAASLHQKMAQNNRIRICLDRIADCELGGKRAPEEIPFQVENPAVINEQRSSVFRDGGADRDSAYVELASRCGKKLLNQPSSQVQHQEMPSRRRRAG